MRGRASAVGGSASSPSGGSSNPGHFLDELRATFADRAARTAIVHGGRVIPYGELEARARRFAARMVRLGLEAGDRVAIITPDKMPFLIAHLATLYAGAVALPLNPRSTPDELRYYLQDSGARVVVAGQDEWPLVEALKPVLPELRALIADREARDAPEATLADAAPGRDDPCLMLYSSGTTGRPKGVVHTHANLAASLRALAACWRFSPDDVVVNVLPLFHIHGLSFATQLTLLVGGSMRVEDQFHPRRTLDVIGRGTVFMAIPTFYYTFLERPEFRQAARGWSSVRLFTCGSAPIRADVLPELESILGRPVINRYGMTEGHVITSLPLDGPWPRGSVGLPVEGIELQVVNEDGTPAAPGQAGSVRLRGPNLFRQYWRRPDATREAFASGWFDTGDVGERDEAGFLTLVGRKNDLIITNGFNVYPQVVERAIDECPGVAESAVIGVPDRRRGERVLAAVVRSSRSLTEQDLRAHLAERLVDYQRPSSIVFVPELPRNAMGKVLRRELRDRLARGGSRPGAGTD